MSQPEYGENFDQAVDWLCTADQIVVLTGAGISAASGIATFRDANGLWKRFPADEFANWKGLLQVAILQPKRLAEFLLAVLQPIAQATPNAAHQAIHRLVQMKPVAVITQNVDGLHQDAGEINVHEIHGNLLEIVTIPGNTLVKKLSRNDLQCVVDDLEKLLTQVWPGAQLLKTISPLLGTSHGTFHRPNLVLFGDQLAEPAWANAKNAVQSCDVLLAVGTSQSVYTEVSLIDEARSSGVKVVVIDPEVMNGDLWLSGTAEFLLPPLIDAVRQKAG